MTECLQMSFLQLKECRKFKRWKKYDKNTDARVFHLKLTYISLLRQSFIGVSIKIRHKINTYISSEVSQKIVKWHMHEMYW